MGGSQTPHGSNADAAVCSLSAGAANSILSPTGNKTPEVERAISRHTGDNGPRCHHPAPKHPAARERCRAAPGHQAQRQQPPVPAAPRGSPVPGAAGKPGRRRLEGKATASRSGTVINTIIVRNKPRALAQHRCSLLCSGLLAATATRAPQIAPTPAASGHTAAAEGRAAGTPSWVEAPPNLRHPPAIGDAAPGEPLGSCRQPRPPCTAGIWEHAPAGRRYLRPPSQRLPPDPPPQQYLLLGGCYSSERPPFDCLQTAPVLTGYKYGRRQDIYTSTVY